MAPSDKQPVHFIEEKVGRKDDSGKTNWWLLPFESVEKIVEVLMYGAKKYAPNNWQLVPNARERYFDAAIRHLVSWKNGEKVDKESGLSHLAHAGCCIVFLLWIEDVPRELDKPE